MKSYKVSFTHRKHGRQHWIQFYSTPELAQELAPLSVQREYGYADSVTVEPCDDPRGTFRARIEDETKTALSPQFISTIQGLAATNGKTEDEVYALWLKYCEDCRNFDQSPVLFEFIGWNKLQAA